MTATDVRKAAILLVSLPEDDAATLMSKLSKDEVEAVSIEIANLGRFTQDEQQRVYEEFAESNPKLANVGGGLSTATGILLKALGDGAAETIQQVQQSIEAMPFGFLKKVDPQNLLTFIIDEHPQTIAVILSNLSAAYGAEIIAGLPTETQLAVIRRIANMGQTNPEIIRQVEDGLANRMSSVMSQSFENAGGIPSVAGILNVTDRATERSLLESLAQDDPELVEEIRRLMFVFEDVAKLSDKEIQADLTNVETAQSAMALKGASEDLKEKILGNMSQRAAEMLQEEIEYLGPVRLSDVEAVQQQIVDIVRSLEESGEITIASGSESEEFVM